ncbi:MAG: hypothetical protein K2M93_00675 [Muribaculaceae bacterium]|nr:hypothetical protein [Muribaculaceae bacterium]
MKFNTFTSTVAGFMCLSMVASAQECKLLFDLEGVRLSSPTEKRLDNNGSFRDSKEQFLRSYRESSDEYTISLPLSMIDSLMNLTSQPDYITVLSTVCQLSDMQPIKEVQKTRLKSYSEELAARQTQVDALISSLGKKITSKEQENLIAEIIEELGSRGIYPPSKTLADLKKGKISKDLDELFNKYSALLMLKSGFASQNLSGLNDEILGVDGLKVLYSLLKYPTYDDLPAYVKEKNETRSGRKIFWVNVEGSEIEFPMKTVVDSIPNPLCAKSLIVFPQNLSKVNSLKIAEAQKDFAWLDSEDYTVKTEQYPMPITYRRYASHPEYKVTDSHGSKGVYDNNGSLVAYVLAGPVGFNPVENNINAIYAHEYEADAYDIKKSDAHVRDHILEKAEVKFHPGSRAQRIFNTKIRRIDKASLAKPDNDYMVKAILAQKEAERITRQDEIDHLKNYDRNGENWCAQIRSDWNNKIAEKGASWTEVISPTSYSVTYMTREGNPAIKEIYKVQNTTPYRIEIVKTVQIL